MLTLQCVMRGLRGCGLDKIFGESQNNSRPEGLRLWLHELTLTKEGALTWWGTECSSFSSMCKFNSQRSHDNMYLGFPGNDDSSFVYRGNLQMTITSLMLFLSHLLRNACVLEQPLGSVMPLAPPLSTVLSFIGAQRQVTWHSAFGAPSAKPFQLLSNRAQITAMQRQKPKHKATIDLVRKDESGSYSGISKNLKSSQAYTAEFAKAVCAAFFGQ